MSKRITKHKIGMDAEPTSLRLPRSGEIKHFGIVGGTPHLWVEEQDGMRTMRRDYRIFATGDDVPDHWSHVATTQDPQTDMSIHLYREEA